MRELNKVIKRAGFPKKKAMEIKKLRRRLLNRCKIHEMQRPRLIKIQTN